MTENSWPINFCFNIYLLLSNSVSINSQRMIKQSDPPLTIYFLSISSMTLTESSCPIKVEYFLSLVQTFIVQSSEAVIIFSPFVWKIEFIPFEWNA